MKYSKITHKLAAAITAGVLLSEGSAAFATTFKNVTTNIISGSSTLPDLVSTVAYIGGIGLGVAGIFKLKQHVDQPAQNPMKDGLVRLGAGGGLLALPFMTSAMMGTIDNGGGTPAASSVGVFSGLGGG